MTKKLIPLTVYIAGPMTGLPDFNYPAFRAAEKLLVNEGFHVLNPADNEADGWLGYMRRALTQIANADIVYFLTGWKASKGASLEHKVAQELGLIIRYESDVCGEQDLQLMKLEGASQAELAKAMLKNGTGIMPEEAKAKPTVVDMVKVDRSDLNILLKFVEDQSATIRPSLVGDSARALRRVTPP